MVDEVNIAGISDITDATGKNINRRTVIYGSAVQIRPGVFYQRSMFSQVP